ncbi:hypothetical protein AB0D49_08020 [Streptomyces sp. NPDC048290]|uniref:hypothetical protein n=1 Tax=Streptomyces sp. NPDC048290 TaxID=3155811 RepID=UPI003437FF05
MTKLPAGSATATATGAGAGAVSDYADAPAISVESSWVALIADRLGAVESDREFWLRRAALLDRMALAEEAEGGAWTVGEAVPVAVLTAEGAARRLVAYDGVHFGLSTRGADIATGADCREYVREEYRAWRLGALR